jgi:hypothetical protein
MHILLAKVEVSSKVHFYWNINPFRACRQKHYLPKRNTTLFSNLNMLIRDVKYFVCCIIYSYDPQFFQAKAGTDSLKSVTTYSFHILSYE